MSALPIKLKAGGKEMIKLCSLTKAYRNADTETLALNGLNLSVESGEFVSVMGPSGSGKSTLLNILGLIDKPTSGEYYLFNQELSGFTEKQRVNLRKLNIAFIFQKFNLIDELTVYKNIELPLSYMNIKPFEQKKRVISVMEQLGLTPYANQFPLNLSGGQQQRVAVARAVVTKPQLLLADEPTGNLDSHNGKDVINLLQTINREGTTIVMSTHSLFMANQSHRIANLFDGEIVTQSFFEQNYQMNKAKAFF